MTLKNLFLNACLKVAVGNNLKKRNVFKRNHLIFWLIMECYHSKNLRKSNVCYFNQ